MARTSLAALPLLPENWEVSVFPAPFSVKEVSLRGLLLVVEASTGAIRMALPVTHEASLATHLRQAFLMPLAPLKVGRPKSVRVDDVGLLGSGRDGAAGALAPHPGRGAVWDGGRGAGRMRRRDHRSRCTQAVVALAAVFPQRGSLEVPTVVGTVTVRAETQVQALSYEWFFNRGYQMMLVHARDSRSPSAILPGLLFKMRKADAVAIMGRFKQIFRLLLIERAGVIQLEAEMDDGRRLVLAQADAHTGELRDHLQVPEVFLILSGGGTQRQSFSGKDAVEQVRVPVVRFC